MGSRGRRQRRRLGVRGALGLVRLLRPAHRPSRTLGSRHCRPAAPAGPRVVRTVGSEAGRALHLRVELPAHRPLPETRFLAGESHSDCRQADRREPQTPLHARLGGDRERPCRAARRIRELTEAVFRGLDLEREIAAAETQGIGDTLVLPGDDELDGVAVVTAEPGAKRGAIPATSRSRRFVLAWARPTGSNDFDACEGFAADSAVERLVAGVNTVASTHIDVCSRGFRIEQIGVAMHLRPGEPALDTPEHYVIDDLR